MGQPVWRTGELLFAGTACVAARRLTGCQGAHATACVCCVPAVQLHTSLGNMVVEYGALHKSNPNRTMLSVRDKQAGSLIDVMFK